MSVPVALVMDLGGLEQAHELPPDCLAIFGLPVYELAPATLLHQMRDTASIDILISLIPAAAGISEHCRPDIES